MNNATKFWRLEGRYQKAKRKAERYIKRQQILNDKADKQLEIMKTAFDEQKKILREMDIDEISCDP